MSAAKRTDSDRREVLLSLTPKGEKISAESCPLHHRTELRTRGPALVAALKRAMQAARVK